MRNRAAQVAALAASFQPANAAMSSARSMVGARERCMWSIAGLPSAIAAKRGCRRGQYIILPRALWRLLEIGRVGASSLSVWARRLESHWASGGASHGARRRWRVRWNRCPAHLRVHSCVHCWKASWRAGSHRAGRAARRPRWCSGSPARSGRAGGGGRSPARGCRGSPACRSGPARRPPWAAGCRPSRCASSWREPNVPETWISTLASGRSMAKLPTLREDQHAAARRGGTRRRGPRARVFGVCPVISGASERSRQRLELVEVLADDQDLVARVLARQLAARPRP